MKVLLYSRVFPPAVGGMERFAEDLATWLSKRGNHVWVVTNTLAAPESDALRTYRVSRGISGKVLMAAAKWADVVHVNGLALRGIVPARIAGRLPVTTHHGHQAICATGLAWVSSGQCSAGPGRGPCQHCPRRGAMGYVAVAGHHLGARATARNVCVSRYLEQRLALPRSLTIYNPVWNQAVGGEGATEEEGLIVFVGRLVAEKGLDLLLRALALLPGLRLEVGGDGPMRAGWEGLARQLGVAERVKFLGRLSLSEVVNLYARATVGCVPSVWDEPFGYAAAEPMAMGKAMVATPRGALPELLADGRGFVASGCTPDALAGTLQGALGDRAARAEAGVRARDFTRRELSIDRIGEQYLKVYEEAVA